MNLIKIIRSLRIDHDNAKDFKDRHYRKVDATTERYRSISPSLEKIGDLEYWIHKTWKEAYRKGYAISSTPRSSIKIIYVDND